MLVSFIGYVLPCGQMSFWGATVIINFLTVIPTIGVLLALLIWGGFNVGKATLGRFFILHVLIPFIISVITCLHIYVLHQVGSSTAFATLIIKEPIKLAMYFKLKDILFIYLMSTSLAEIAIVSYIGHSANYILASPLVTPEHIVPEWYFLSLYAILRGIPNKLFGILSMFSFIWIFTRLLLNTEYDSSVYHFPRS